MLLVIHEVYDVELIDSIAQENVKFLVPVLLINVNVFSDFHMSSP